MYSIFIVFFVLQSKFFYLFWTSSGFSQAFTPDPVLYGLQTYRVLVLSGRHSAYNWLTGSTVDTLADYTLSSDSASSLLVFDKKRAERSPAWRAVGANFGSKRLTNSSDETDSRSAGQLALTQVP